MQILQQSYPPEIPPKTQEVIDLAVKEIDKDPALIERVISALRAGGIEALKELTDNPYVNILIAAYEAWGQMGEAFALTLSVRGRDCQANASPLHKFGFGVTKTG